MASNTLPYLQKLRKDRLVQLAVDTNLSEYEDLNKPDLVIALDKHLRQHQDDFDQNPNFIDYYKRLSLPPRSTPRREIKSDPSATPDRDLRMSTRRRRRPAKLISNDSEEAPSNAESPTPSDAAETPARHSLLPQVAIPTSLATGSRTTDRPTRWTRKRIYDALSDSRPVHWISVLREWLSDFKVIQVLIVVVEAIWVVIHLLPVRGSASWPDFLPLASSSVWASFSLWLLTNVLVPLAFAFFCNVSKATILRNHNRVYSTRSVSVAASEESNIDYLSFCIARGLIGYIIYGNKVSVAGLLSRSAISKVNAAYPGRWVGMLIAASIGAVEALYQAVLRRQF